MTDQPGTDVEARGGGITRLITRYRPDFAAVVPSHVPIDQFMTLAIGQVRRDQFLRRAAQRNPAGLIIALRHCAALGHLPIKGIASLVAYGNDITLIEEWRGVVERMFRAGGVRAVHPRVVRKNDLFDWVEGAPPIHKFDRFAPKSERGPLMGTYAWTDMLGGGISEVVWLNWEDVQRARSMSKSAMKEGSGGGNFWGPAWPDEGPNTEAMWKKTALHRLEGLVPTSAEYRWQMAAADAAAQTHFRDIDAPTFTPDIIDLDEDAVVEPAGGDGEIWPETAKPPQTKG